MNFSISERSQSMLRSVYTRSVSGPVQCRCRRLELRQDRYRHILLAELLLQNYGAGCRQNRSVEYTLQEPVLLSSEEQGGN